MKNKLTEPLKNKQSALTASLVVTEPLDSPSRRGQVRPAVSPVHSVKLIAERASVTARSLQELYGERCDAYRHWGLNE
jgi:hypothetical protein